MMDWLWKRNESYFINDWQLLKELGEGSSASVVLVRHRKTKERAAIKIFDLRLMVSKWKQLNKTEDARKRVLHEIDVLRELKHQNIAKLISISHVRHYSYMIMELVEGGELFDYIQKRGTLKELEARLFFRQLISAIEYCHGHFIVHRDLKLENILLDRSHRTIKLIDFGLSEQVRPGELLYSCCGSLDYVAPEVLRRRGYVGPPSDVWSLGVILFTMLHGRLPFSLNSQNTKQRLCCLCACDYRIDSAQLSPECVHLICELLCPNPQQRISVEMLRIHAWVNRGHPEPPPCELPCCEPEPEPDSNLIAQLCYFGFEPVWLIERLRAGTHCQAVSMYHSLKKRAKPSYFAPPSPHPLQLQSI
jgi:serine/threonine protein kinase